MEKDTHKKQNTKKRSLLYSVVIFNFWIPLFLVVVLLTNTQQIITDGEISRGGVSRTCQSTDYDPRGGGGYICEGNEEYVHEPIRYISFTEALIEDLSTIMKVIPFTLLFGIGFGLYYHKSNQSNP